jgi:hypothetical protein
MAKHVDFYVANSEQTWRDLRAIGVPPEKMTVITPPVDLGKYDHAIDCTKQRGEFGIAESDLCFDPRLAHGVERAAVFIKAARPSSSAFQTPGPLSSGLPGGANPGYEREMLTWRRASVSATRSSSPASGMTCPDDPDAERHRACFADAEPFGRVIIESMAMKKPVIEQGGRTARNHRRRSNGFSFLLVTTPSRRGSRSCSRILASLPLWGKRLMQRPGARTR